MPPRTTPAEQLERLKRQLAGTQHLLEKLTMIRALHMVTYTSTTPVEKLAVEFYYAIGDILEGQKSTELNLTVINKDEFFRELTDDK